MLSIKCPNCGGTIHFDKDHVITFCSFCGSHLPDMTEYVKQATQLEIQEKKHAMEMETLQKEIRRERAKKCSTKNPKYRRDCSLCSIGCCDVALNYSTVYVYV